MVPRRVRHTGGSGSSETVPFTGAAGQLHAFWSAIGQVVEGDVNGDAKPDFSIELKDPTHAIILASTDFLSRAGRARLRWLRSPRAGGGRIRAKTLRKTGALK